MVSKKLACAKCEKRFSSKLDLARHAAIHKRGKHLVTKPMKKAKSSQKVHKCEVCEKCFPSKFKLIRHGYSHMAIKPFPCDICERRFSRKDHLQVHYRIHTGEKTCFCMECGEGFNTTTSLHRHIIRLHSEDKKIVDCPECGVEFAFKAQLKRHYDYAHRESYTCNICGNISTSDGALHRHLKKHILSQPFVCLMCAAHFNAPEDMRVHQCFALEEDPCKVVVRVALLDSFIFDEEIDFADRCTALRLEKKFDKRGRRPKQLDDEYESYGCQNEVVDLWKEDTGEAVEVFQNYKNVADKFFNNVNSNYHTYFCKCCEKSFDTKESLDAHVINTHLVNGKRNSLSDTYDEPLFSTNRHVSYRGVHTKHLCKFCNNLFPSKDHLQMHMFGSHTTDDETCPFCFEFCQSAEKLREHLKSHQEPEVNKTDFACKYCDSHFHLQSQLQHHVRSVHRNGKYNCKYCQEKCEDLSAKLSHEQDCKAGVNFGNEDEEKLMIEENKDDGAEKSDSNPSNMVPNLWKCKSCKLTFKTMKERTRHIKLFHNESFCFDCKFCPCKFASVAGLRGHINNFHNLFLKSKNVVNFDSYIDSAAETNHCNDCGESFVFLHEFIEHVQSHSNSQCEAQELSCILCGEKFNVPEELDKHLKDHEDGMIVEVGVHGAG